MLPELREDVEADFRDAGFEEVIPKLDYVRLAPFEDKIIFAFNDWDLRESGFFMVAKANLIQSYYTKQHCIENKVYEKINPNKPAYLAFCASMLEDDNYKIYYYEI